MKKVMLALALMVLLSVLASAENDSVTTGPYKVSFDLGVPHNTYNVTIPEPKSTESLSGDKSTTYVIKVHNNTGITNFIDIDITHYDAIQPTPTAEELESVIRQILVNDPNTSNIETAMRTIDDSQGAIGSADVSISGFKMKSYMAGYRFKADPAQTAIVIISSEPWEEGTLQLLKTIHIEKIKS